MIPLFEMNKKIKINTSDIQPKKYSYSSAKAGKGYQI